MSGALRYLLFRLLDISYLNKIIISYDIITISTASSITGSNEVTMTDRNCFDNMHCVWLI